MIIDARGLICPLPVLKARKILLSMQPGEKLVVQVTDNNAKKDFPLFCAESGHSLESIEDKENFSQITVRCRKVP